MNNVGGGVEAVRRKEAILLEHCAAVGRDPSEIERTTGIGTVFIRDDRAEAERLFRAAFERNRVARAWADQPVGTPEDVAERLAPYRRDRLPAPGRRLPGHLRRGVDDPARDRGEADAGGGVLMGRGWGAAAVLVGRRVATTCSTDGGGRTLRHRAGSRRRWTDRRGPGRDARVRAERSWPGRTTRRRSSRSSRTAGSGTATGTAPAGTRGSRSAASWIRRPSPACSSWGADRLDVFARGRDGGRGTAGGTARAGSPGSASPPDRRARVAVVPGATAQASTGAGAAAGAGSRRRARWRAALARLPQLAMLHQRRRPYARCPRRPSGTRRSRRSGADPVSPATTQLDERIREACERVLERIADVAVCGRPRRPPRRTSSTTGRARSSSLTAASARPRPPGAPPPANPRPRGARHGPRGCTPAGHPVA